MPASRRPSPAADPSRRRLIQSLVVAGAGSWPLAGWSAPASSPEAAMQVPLAVGDHVNRDFVLPLLNLLAQAAGWRWDLQYAPMARVLALLERGDCLAFGLGRTPAREGLLAFSDPLFSSRVWPVYRRGRSLPVRSLADLQGRTVCLSRAASYGAQVDAAKGRDFRVEYADGDPRSRLRMLLADRCDVALMTHRSADPAALERRLREEGGQPLQVDIGPVPLVSEPVHIAGALGSPWLRVLPALNAALRRQQPAIQALVDSSL